jgi:hypothetical protein
LKQFDEKQGKLAGRLDRLEQMVLEVGEAQLRLKIALETLARPAAPSAAEYAIDRRAPSRETAPPPEERASPRFSEVAAPGSAFPPPPPATPREEPAVRRGMETPWAAPSAVALSGQPASYALPSQPVAAPAESAVEAAGVPPRTWKLPDNWAGAVNEPCPVQETDQPSETAFIERLHCLLSNLRALDPALPVSLVHLQERDGNFEVHDATRTGPGEAVCSRCGTSQSWQLAVCTGQRGEGDLLIFFPPGLISQYKYPAGYSELMEDVSGIFRISSIRQPARLRAGFSDQYRVAQKLRWAE